MEKINNMIVMEPFRGPEDVEPILTYLSNRARITDKVFWRKTEDFAKPIELKRGVRLSLNDQICGVIFLYMMADGREIDVEVAETGEVESGRVCEFGTMVRSSKKRVSTDPAIPGGPWKFILTSGLKFYALQRGIPVDIVTMGVCNGEDTRRIRADIARPPVNFHAFVPAKEYLDAAGELVNHADLSNTSHYRAYASKENLITEATLWQQIAADKKVRDIRQPNDIGYNPNLEIDIDISRMKFEPLLKCIVERGQYYMKDLPVTESWAEVSRQFRSRSKKKWHNPESYPYEATRETIRQPGESVLQKTFS